MRDPLFKAVLPWGISRKLVVVSNREPYSVSYHQKTLQLQKNAGGLVTALDPILREHRGLWICWEGQGAPPVNSLAHLHRLTELNGMSIPYDIRGVSLTQEEVQHYYYGYANRQIWPIFHHFPIYAHYHTQDWVNYSRANEKFAQVVLEESQAPDLIWIQDYHLLLVPERIRYLDARRNIGFFCHIPFPCKDIFQVLPQREALLKGILGSDLIGFHTQTYVDHFIECVKAFVPKVLVEREDTSTTLFYENRRIQVGAFPIAVDFEGIQKMASSASQVLKAQALKQSFQCEFLGIGVDRLDYTKGILERLDAVEAFFTVYPEYKKRLVFLQIAVPSRTEVAEYQQLKHQVDEKIGQINGTLSQGAWHPIHYYYGNFPFETLMDFLMSADFALVTPLKDGMNLVAKEYCAAQGSRPGVLILSEFAGAADQLTEALLVNPYDRQQMVHAMHQALTMGFEEKQQRMHCLQRQLQQHDIHHWLQCYLHAFSHAIQHRGEPPSVRGLF